MTTLTTKALNQKIETFIDLFRQGVEAWIKAGEILVEMVDNDPHTYDYIIEKCPTLNPGILGRFEQIGRKILHPQLLLTASPGFARLRRLPFSMQERFIEEPVALVVHTDEGTDVMLVKAQNMTKDQAEQAFGPGRLRTEGEQKAWLMDQRSKKAKPIGSNLPAWSIRGGRVIFNEGATLSAGELATIITQLTK